MEKLKHSKTAFVLEGGAMRGLYSAGVLDVFMQNNITTDAIYGVSAGALFGINFKSAQIGRAIRYNLKYAHKKDYMGLYSLVTTGDIMNKDFCFNKLVNELDRFDFETFDNSPIDFFAVVTNVESGCAEYIKITDGRKDLEALRATGSMPFVSRCVDYNGSKYLDGAISDPIPFQKVLDEGYEKIIVVLTRPENYRKKREKLPYNLFYGKYPNFIKTANKQFEKYNDTLDLIEKYENKGKIIVFRPSQNLKIARVEKNSEKLKAIYKLGVDDSVSKLDKVRKYLSGDLV
ncbi:MAG: patatin family protein [Candidatus Gastranaerophilales bacterium]|nr:patatin family protein [Candidatus Gastranaerophilales bacterium]